MKKIYFIGINGIGMSGLAKIMKKKNYDVVGADIQRSHVTEEMEEMEIKVFKEHKEEQVCDCDMVIASSAIIEQNPEYLYAKKNNIKILKRGELLALLLDEEDGIAVAGTHGKTTTTAMISSTMLSLDPTIVIGGILPEIGSNSKIGSSKYFIAEADESDKSFLFMHPKYSIITNVEEDHMENYGDIESIKKSFSKFIDQTKEEAIVCIDGENLCEIVKEKKSPKITTYSVHNTNANIYAKNIHVKNGCTSFEVVINGQSLGNFCLCIPGEHNVANSLPVIYLSHKLGVSSEGINRALTNFKGSKRRYDILYYDQNKEIKIIDDYAHHPTEINATLNGAKSVEKGDITVIFQPHRYSRVKFLLSNFKNSFDKAAEVFLLPIYSAGEKNNFGITLEDLKNKISNKNVKIEEDINNVENYILNCDKNKVFIFMGAGDISKIAHNISDKMERKRA